MAALLKERVAAQLEAEVARKRLSPGGCLYGTEDYCGDNNNVYNNYDDDYYNDSSDKTSQGRTSQPTEESQQQMEGISGAGCSTEDANKEEKHGGRAHNRTSSSEAGAVESPTRTGSPEPECNLGLTITPTTAEDYREI